MYPDAVSWHWKTVLEQYCSSTDVYCYFNFHFNRQILAFYIHIRITTQIKEQSLQQTVKLGALTFVCDIIMMQYWKNHYMNNSFSVRTQYWCTVQDVCQHSEEK